MRGRDGFALAEQADLAAVALGGDALGIGDQHVGGRD